MRKIPAPAFVARYHCPEQHTTFSLLPDFYASRVPGTLDDLEQAVATAEVAASVEKAADQLRPASVPDSVTLAAAVAWLRRRIAWMRALLVTVAGLFPDDFAGVGRSVLAFRERLGTSHVLVKLREICEPHLYMLPRPLGLNPRRRPAVSASHGRRQSAGPDPPARPR